MTKVFESAQAYLKTKREKKKKGRCKSLNWKIAAFPARVCICVNETLKCVILHCPDDTTFPHKIYKCRCNLSCQKLPFLPSALNHSQLTGWIQPYVNTIIFWLTKDQTKLINLWHFCIKLMDFLYESSQIHHFCQGVAHLMLLCYEAGYWTILNVAKQAEVVAFYS